MISEREMHFVLATIEAQTREMNGSYQSVSLDHRKTSRIFAKAAHLYGLHRTAQMNQILEYALDSNEPYDDEAQRHGYKIACGIEFNRRKQEKRGIQHKLDGMRLLAKRERDSY